MERSGARKSAGISHQDASVSAYAIRPAAATASLSSWSQVRGRPVTTPGAVVVTAGGIAALVVVGACAGEAAEAFEVVL